MPVDTSPPDRKTYVFLSSIIRRFAHGMFPGYKLNGAWPFRVTRNSDLYIDEEEAENLIVKIEEELHRLRRGAAVRLEISEDAEDSIVSRSCSRLSTCPRTTSFASHGPVNLLRLFNVVDDIGRDRPELHLPALPAARPAGPRPA